MSDVTETMAGVDNAAPSTASAAGLVLLYAAEHAAMPRVFVLARESVLVGREPPPNGWLIPQAAASRVHASLTRTKESFRLRDLESRNGTWVNDARISEHDLAEGDRVRIGDALFKFTSDAKAHEPFALADTSQMHIAGAVGGLAIARVAHEVEVAVRTGGSTLVLGETGVGKELVARALHGAASRAGPFVAVNCAALPAQLVESELFGHERGAFTGATTERDGTVRAAHRGTLFLDEIGDLPLEAQAKLLRVLESSEVVPVGATRAHKVDVRVVAATNRDLRAMAKEGRFRPDLMARIEGYAITIPPLRDRIEDLYALLTHFCARAGRTHVDASFGFVAALASHAWPMNVRELASAVRRAVVTSDGGTLQRAHLPPSVLAAPVPTSSAQTQTTKRRKSPSDRELRGLLAKHGGNVSQVARDLDRDAAQIYRWMRKYGIEPDEHRR